MLPSAQEIKQFLENNGCGGVVINSQPNRLVVDAVCPSGVEYCLICIPDCILELVEGSVTNHPNLDSVYKAWQDGSNDSDYEERNPHMSATHSEQMHRGMQ